MQYWYFLEVRGQPSASALTVSLVWGRLFCWALNVPGSLDCKPLGSLLFPLLIPGGCSGAQHFCGLPGFRLRCLCSKFFTHWPIFSAPRVFLSLKKRNCFYFFMFGDVLPVHLVTTYVQWPMRPEEGIISSGPGITEACELCGWWEIGPMSLGRSTSALGHWVSSPGPNSKLFLLVNWLCQVFVAAMENVLVEWPSPTELHFPNNLFLIQYAVKYIFLHTICRLKPSIHI